MKCCLSYLRYLKRCVALLLEEMTNRQQLGLQLRGDSAPLPAHNARQCTYCFKNTKYTNSNSTINVSESLQLKNDKFNGIPVKNTNASSVYCPSQIPNTSSINNSYEIPTKHFYQLEDCKKNQVYFNTSYVVLKVSVTNRKDRNKHKTSSLDPSKNY